jgi:VCBS repeat-containing protein
VVDSGTGNDTVTTGAGNDLVSYHVTGNASHHNMFTAAAGIDTLNLVMTRAEWMSDAVQTDVASYLSFLAANKGPSGENNATSYAFTAFGLTTSGFEKLQVHVDGVSVDPANHPVAVDDLIENTVMQVASVLTFEEGTYSRNGNYSPNTWKFGDTMSTEGFSFALDTNTNSNSNSNTNNYGFSSYVRGYWGANDSNTLYSFGYCGDDNGGPSTTLPIAMTHADGSSFSLTSANITGYSDHYDGSVYETVTGYSHGVQVAQQSFNVPDTANGGNHNNVVTFTDPGFSSVDKVVFSLTSNGNSHSYNHKNYNYMWIDNVGVNTTAVIAQTVLRTVDINVLANDTDVDSGAHLSVGSFSGFSAHGAAITLNPDGTLHYNPTGSAELQALSKGTDVYDSFTYQAQDQFGDLSNQATVSIHVVGVAHAASL